MEVGPGTLGFQGRKGRSSKDSLIWRCRISRFLRRQNWVLTPASLTLIISPPRPNQIRWTRGNESLPERAEAVGETLTLPGLVSADNGTYTCEASNKHGHARALYVLVVYGEDLGAVLPVLGGTGPWGQEGRIGTCLRRRSMQRMIPGGQKPTEFL